MVLPSWICSDCDRRCQARSDVMERLACCRKCSQEGSIHYRRDPDQETAGEFVSWLCRTNKTPDSPLKMATDLLIRLSDAQQRTRDAWLEKFMETVPYARRLGISRENEDRING